MRSEKSHKGRTMKQVAIAALAFMALAGTAKASGRLDWSLIEQSSLSGPFVSAVRMATSATRYFNANGLPSSELASSAKRGNLDTWTDSISTGSIPKSFFGTVAVPFSSIAVRSQWERVRQQSLPSASDCTNSSCKARVAKLRDAAHRGKSLGFSAKLSLANATVNSVIEYKSDRVAYGKLDHWASSREMVQKGAGDCEDFAILKQTLLRAMGVPDKSLSIVILKDNGRNLYHAVLGVSTNQGHLVLDNVRASVFRDTQVANYQPLFSFSGSRSWVHGYTAGPAAVAAGKSPSLNSIAPGESAIIPVMISASGFNIMADLRPTLRD